MLIGMRQQKSGIPGKLIGIVRGSGRLAGGLTNSLKGAIAPAPALSGGLTLRRALAGTIPGGATFTSNLSGGPGQLRGAIPHTATISGGLAKSLRGSVSAAATIVGSVSKLKALVGNVPGAATFTSALTGAGGMPSGAAGIWYAQDYVATPRKAIKNSVATSSPSSNLLASSTNFPFVIIDDNSTTETRRYAAGPSGVGTTASRVVGSGSNNYYSVSRYLKAGTYTIAADYKSNTGADQTFNLGIYGGTKVAKTITSAWQRLSMQFVVAADGAVSNIGWAISTSTFDFLIDNVALYPGSVDFGAPVLEGHMYFDRDPLVAGGTANPSAGIVDLSTSGSALTQFPSNLNLSTFTIGALIRRVSASDNGYNALFSDAIGGYSSFSAYVSQGGAPLMQMSASSVASEPNVSGAWDQNGVGWHLITYRYDGTNFCIFFDNQMIYTAPATLAAPMSLSSFLSFAVNSLGANTTSYQMNSMFFYPSALTSTQVKTAAYNALTTKAAQNGVSISARRIITNEGDSISAGSGGTPYHTLAQGNLTTPFTKAVLAKSGNTIADAVARAAIIGGSSGSGQDILTILMGANDLQSYGGATDAAKAQNWCNAMFAYTDERRAAGYRVGLGTILPNGTTSGVNAFNSVRNLANPILRAAVGTHIDFIIDFDSDAQMGADNSFGLYPANWADSIHPSTAGQTRLEPIYRAAINALA